MNIQSIRNEYFALDMLPEVGASVLNLCAASGRPVLRHVDSASVQTSSQCGSFTLLPYSNRIRDARFIFEGREVRLVPGVGGSVQHGDVRNRPWQVEQVSGTHLVCTCNSEQFLREQRQSKQGEQSTQVNWPWAFSARVEYILHGPHFDTSVTLTNQSDSAMPAGMGLHPYFARVDAAQTDPTLIFQAGGVYLTDDSFIPTRGPQPVPPELDFSAARMIGEAQYNHVFSSWDGVARLAWAAEGAERALVMTADGVYSHLVLFTAPDGSLAIEPVTHSTDAFNLAAGGVHGTDMRVLAPGQSLSGAVRLSLEGKW